MRRQHGAIEAIERLVQSGDIQSGFKRLQQMALLDWTIEAAVIKLRASLALPRANAQNGGWSRSRGVVV
jgi:hypothetical protein